MKPSWDDAPEWANWLAMDGDGIWFWHECEPEIGPRKDEWVSAGAMISSGCGDLWKGSKESRP